MKKVLFYSFSLFLSISFISCTENSIYAVDESSFDEINDWMSIKNELSCCVSKCSEDILAYAYSDGHIDYEFVGEVLSENMPSAIKECSPVIQTKSNQSDVFFEFTPLQEKVLVDLMNLAEGGSFNFNDAIDIVFDSDLSGDDLSEMCNIVAVASGIYEGLSLSDITKALSESQNKYICDVLAGTCVAIWTGWGAAIAVGLGVCTGGVATAVTTVVSIAVTPLMSKAFGC